MFSNLFGVLLPWTLQLQPGFCPCSIGGTDTNRSLKYIGGKPGVSWENFNIPRLGNSLEFQWLGLLCAFTTEGPDLIPDQGREMQAAQQGQIYMCTHTHTGFCSRPFSSSRDSNRGLIWIELILFPFFSKTGFSILGSMGILSCIIFVSGTVHKVFSSMTTGMPVATSSCDNQKCLHVTAGWAQSLAGSHCCTLLLRTLLLGNRSCSAVGWYLSRPCPQASINERLLVALPSYWSAPQWALPTGTVNEGTLGERFSQGQWCGGHQVESEVRGRFRLLLEALQLTQPWANGWAGGPREQAGHSVLQGFRALTQALHAEAQALRQQWTCLWPNSSVRLSGSQSVRPGLPYSGSLRRLRASLVGCPTLSGVTGGQCAEPGPEELSLRSASS